MARQIKKDKVSPSELEVLKYVIERAPVAGREVADAMSESKGMARTTALTLLDRLLKKGHVERTLQHGVHVYRPAEDGAKTMKGLVADFVENTLGGSLSPFVAFLSDHPNLTEQEATELRKLLDKSAGGK